MTEVWGVTGAPFGEEQAVAASGGRGTKSRDGATTGARCGGRVRIWACVVAADGSVYSAGASTTDAFRSLAREGKRPAWTRPVALGTRSTAPVHVPIGALVVR